MIVISVGTETKLLEMNSRVYNRIKEYSTFASKYYCFVFTRSRKERVEDGNFTVVPVVYKRKSLFFFPLANAIRKEKIKDKRDVVLSSQDPFEVGFFTYLISKMFGYRFQVQVHTDISSKYFRRESVRNFFQYKLSKFVIKRAGSVRVVSSKLKVFLVEKWGLEAKKIFVAPVFAGDLVEGSGFAPALEQKHKTLLVLSRLEKVKNIDLAAQSFLELVKDQKYSDYKLKIFGSGTQEKYLKQKYGKYKNIFFENFTTNPFDEYRKAKLLLLTSWYEGWGMTPVESVSCGTPVVMTNVGCANEFIFDNLNGVVSSSFKVKDFVAAIKKALYNYETFTPEKLANSMKMLQSKEEYLRTLHESASFTTPGGRDTT
jgi:glycosyltransferase involved in cell wall biosynthesis